MPLISLTSPGRYVLEGRIVTMAAQGVIADGAIFIEDGAIQAVKPVDAPAPAGFEQAERVRTGDTLYPGLIELHNHLSYNAIPLWLLDRNFTNNGQWRGTHEYRRNVTGPAKVLGKTAGLVEAVIRFAECRSLLGGTTTSQGITLIGVGTKDFYPGLVRNVEAPLLPGLSAAGTRIDNPPNKEEDKPGYLDAQHGVDCYLQHLSEGIDDTARNWFLRLQRVDGSWAIHNSLCGIHSAALAPEDFEVLVAHGASMVWSPLSNYLLYGGTVDVEAVADSGIKVGLGSDWAPSGSKSLLGELKVAWLASQQAGGVFTAERLVRMATIEPAEILRWNEHVGSIEAGKRADIIAINGMSGDPFRHLIEARETSLTLVVIDGIPRVGQPRLMNRFALTDPEELSIGQSRRVLHLAQEGVHDLVGDLTLAEATSRLQDALENLPALAGDLESALLSGLTAGMAGSPLSPVQLELELDDEPIESMLGSLAEDLFPMELEPITVADDPNFLPKLVAAYNLPSFIKEGLPALYGEPVPPPFEAREEAFFFAGLPPRVNASVQTLRQFLSSWRKLTLDERKRIVAQAQVILTQNYVHLPFKRSMHGIDPGQQLRLLRYQLDQADDESLEPDIDFHTRLTRIFHSLRDLHTTYRLPYPFWGVVAWLPFFVEEYWNSEKGRYQYVISKVIGEALDQSALGAELLYWNGVPIAQAIAINAERHAGNNPDARRARGLNALTLRPLGQGLPPDEDWVTITYRDTAGNIHEARQEWLVFVPRSVLRGRSVVEANMLANTAMGIDDHTLGVQEAKAILFASGELKEKATFEPTLQEERITNADDSLRTSMPTAMRARVVTIDGQEFGHIRIFTFNVPSAAEFIGELGRLLRLMPANGVIVDIRGNGGGLIPAAEGALALFAAQRIDPQRGQFINTPLNLRLCELHAQPGDETALDRWIPSLRESVQTGAIYSQGFPITDPDFVHKIKQRYEGPVALITDGLCYSAADLFAAGFQDHALGPIIGVHRNTGAGGANVWSHSLLRLLATSREGELLPEYAPLPEGADFLVAMRRTIRSGLNAGDVVEDLGIVPDVYHPVTRDDLMAGNRDLLKAAAQVLVQWQAARPRIQFRDGGKRLGKFDVDLPAGSSGALTVNLRVAPIDAEGGETTVLDLDDILATSNRLSITLEVSGQTPSGQDYTYYASLSQDADEQGDES
jgi:cytosine/adenosine deaminase-related metal-dependent hydrolase/C-terminal processing protease CtpA/Prc